MTDRPLTPEQSAALVAALQVLVLDQRHLRWLQTHDPQALQQARQALRDAGAPATVGEVRRRLETPPAGRGAAAYAALMREADATPPRTPPVCGLPIDAAVPGACERTSGHGGPCRAYSLEAPLGYVEAGDAATPASGVQHDAGPTPLHPPLCSCVRCQSDPRRGQR